MASHGIRGTPKRNANHSRLVDPPYTHDSRRRDSGKLPRQVSFRAASLLLVLSMVERLAKTVMEGEAAPPPVRRDAMMEQAERALCALLDQ